MTPFAFSHSRGKKNRSHSHSAIQAWPKIGATRIQPFNEGKKWREIPFIQDISIHSVYLRSHEGPSKGSSRAVVIGSTHLACMSTPLSTAALDIVQARSATACALQSPCDTATSTSCAAYAHDRRPKYDHLVCRHSNGRKWCRDWAHFPNTM